MRHTLTFSLLSLVLVPALVRAAEPGAPAEDSWAGQPREAIEAILGDADSVKPVGGGETQLVYKMRRLAPGEPVGEGVVVFQLPDGGLAGRVLHGRMTNEKVGLEPSALDEHGRPVPGGFSRSESQSASVQVGRGKERKLETDPFSVTGPPVQGRVKVVFVVGADGRVARWQVDPKREK